MFGLRGAAGGHAAWNNRLTYNGTPNLFTPILVKVLTGQGSLPPSITNAQGVAASFVPWFAFAP
jgi:hypothetical protein